MIAGVALLFGLFCLILIMPIVFFVSIGISLIGTRAAESLGANKKDTQLQGFIVLFLLFFSILIIGGLFFFEGK
jgi:hypothetical protein